jgi:outer membrane protein assembly factor BamB
MRRAALVLGLAAAMAAPSDARGQATSFQAGPAHTGFVREPGLSPPLRRAWSHRLPGEVSHPIIAGGRVFVTAATSNGRARQLVALSARTGRRLWRRDGIVHAAYDQGRLFVTHIELEPETKQSLVALSPVDGRELWRQTVYPIGGPPVASGGVVIQSSGAVIAYRATDGARLWITHTGASAAMPAIVGDTVYVAWGCGQYALARDTGTVRWQVSYGCTGGGADIPVFHAGRLYVREDQSYPPGAVHDATTGARLGSMRADHAPAFAGGLGLFPDARLPDENLLFEHTLVARSLADGRVRWRFDGDGYLDTPPLIVNDTVYVGSGTGRLYGLSLRRGRVAWRTRLRQPVHAASESGIISGLGAGEGLLVVPAFQRLVAFR